MLRYCETKKFDGKTWYPPVLSINSFATGKCLKHSTEGFLYELLRYCETKQVRRKIVTAAPSLTLYNFPYQSFSETQKVSSRKAFGTVRQNFSDGKPWYSPSPIPLSINFFTSESFLKHSTEGFLYEMLRYCEKEQVRRKLVIIAPSLISYKIRDQKFSVSQKVSSTKVSVTVRQKFFDAKNW